MSRSICVVTNSRSEYGYLYWPMRRIAESSSLDLQLVVSGMHLAEEFGETWREIERDGFHINAKVDISAYGLDNLSVSRTVAAGVDGFSAAYDDLKPDLVLLLGDRYETLAAATAALLMRIPIAHIAGGDVSEGAFDESIRHAITKMSAIHFVTNKQSAARVLQMGENPEHIHQVGSPGIDFIKRMEFQSRDAFFKTVGLDPRAKNIVVTYHPTTLGDMSPEDEADTVCAALGQLDESHGLIVTGANADPGGAAMNAAYRRFAESHSNAVFRVSLGQNLYLNALFHCDVCLGNTSSGLYEAPAFGTPSVNIGDRQFGRLRAASVVESALDEREIVDALMKAVSMNPQNVENPYGDGTASEQIVGILENISDPRNLLRKPFYAK